MKQLIFLWIIILSITNVYASKDKREKPKNYKFVFENKDTLLVKKTDKALLLSICKEINEGKKKLTFIIIYFDYGREIVFDYSKNKLNSIKSVINPKRPLWVPKNIIDKLHKIKFESLCLLSGKYHYREPKENYYIIQFEINTKIDFNHYPVVQLNYSDLKFSKAIVTKWDKKNHSQRFNLENHVL